MKFSIKKKLTNKENQPKINKSEIKVDSSSSLENQNIQKFDKDEEQEWKKAPMEGENEVDKEKDLVMENSALATDNEILIQQLKDCQDAAMAKNQ